MMSDVDIDWGRVILVYVDGPEDIGKTTLIDRLMGDFDSMGYRVLYFKQPVTGIPDWVKGFTRNRFIRALGYELDRVLLQESIVRVLGRQDYSKPIIVFIDRSFISTWVYQTSATLSSYYMDDEHPFTNLYSIPREVLQKRAVFIVFNREDGSDESRKWSYYAKQLSFFGYVVLNYIIIEGEHVSAWCDVILGTLKVLLRRCIS